MFILDCQKVTKLHFVREVVDVLVIVFFRLQCDSAQQLTNVRQLRVVKYRYDPEFSDHCGLDTQSDTGIIAQELRNILPEAVMPAGDIILPSGTRIDNFLVVNKVIISLCLYA